MTRTNAVSLAEQVGHGLLLGGLVGLVSGMIEYALLLDAFSGSPARAFWNIVVPYAILGLGGGLLVALAVRLVRGAPPSMAAHAARLTAWLVALTALAFTVAWTTFRLGSPVLKLANLIAYAVAAGLALALALLLDAALRRVLAAVARRLEGSRAPLRVAFPAALAILALVGVLLPAGLLARTHSVAAVSASPAAPAADRPNVVVILIDALRADHLPPYGYSRQTAPVLTALARQGVTFSQAYAQASYTRAAVATLLSSLYPSVHKANDDRDFLSRAVPVMPERFKAAGYRTFGISSNANVSPTFGYSRGFDEFRVWKSEREFRLTLAGRLAEKILTPSRLSRVLMESRDIVPTADAITDSTLEWVARTGREPFFLYVHYIDPHDPYHPPAPYDRTFDYRKDPPRRHTVDPLELVPPGVDRDRVGRTLDLYDGEILYADHHIGRLLRDLEERGLLRNTVVVVTADHGEEFFEHGDEIHGRSAYEEVLRVPLIVAWPGRVPPGTVSPALVGHIDLMPTLLDLAGIAAPPGVQGRSLRPLLTDPGAAWPARSILAQVIQKGFTIEAIREGRYKFIRHSRGPRMGTEELYDLEADPRERTNLATDAPARVAGLRKSLEVFNEVLSRTAADIPAEQVRALDRDTERALRSLGYIK